MAGALPAERGEGKETDGNARRTLPRARRQGKTGASTTLQATCGKVVAQQRGRAQSGQGSAHGAAQARGNPHGQEHQPLAAWPAFLHAGCCSVAVAWKGAGETCTAVRRRRDLQTPSLCHARAARQCFHQPASTQGVEWRVGGWVGVQGLRRRGPQQQAGNAQLPSPRLPSQQQPWELRCIAASRIGTSLKRSGCRGPIIRCCQTAAGSEPEVLVVDGCKLHAQEAVSRQHQPVAVHGQGLSWMPTEQRAKQPGSVDACLALAEPS